MRSLTLMLPATICSILICSTFAPTAARADEGATVKIAQLENHLEVTLGGKPFTSYWYAKRDDRPYVRPFFFPVMAPGDVPVTSDQYAVVEIQKVPKSDHPHHQSLWVSHGDVNGVDHWSLAKGADSPKQRHVKFSRIDSDGFAETLQWENNDHQPMLDETRTVRFVAFPDGNRAIDIASAFTPIDGPITFADTKEAGLMAVRLATSIAARPTLTQST
ncbi:MAG: transrane prediction, partial [Phycisphaerales bacterium]|nr:transrane prediction [Phycisphaerales bacterium]